jgi:hypothetical protein
MTKAKPDYLDFDGDNNTKESMKKALRDKKSKSVKEGLIGGQTKIDVAVPYGKLTSADFKELRKGKKKKIKEGYSNWREDLIEIADKIPTKEKEQKIVEKQVNNEIKINPKLDLGEALENLGGTLIEMIEIDEVDFIVESVYEELLDEGYEEDDIEEALEYALIEAKVTFGHDTPTKEKKGRNLLGAVGRLARQKLSSKYRGAKRAVSSAAVSGLRNVAKGALSAARKIEGDKKPSKAHTKTRTASTYRGAGVGQREKVSSGSYSAPKSAPKPSPRASTPVADPWEGSYKTQPKKSAPKPQAKTTTISSKPLSKEQETAVIRAQRRNPNLSGEDARRIVASVPSKEDRQAETRRRMDRAGARIGVSEDYYDLASKSVKPGKPGEDQKITIETLASKARKKKKTRNPVGTARRGSSTFNPSSPEEAEANKKSWDDYWSSVAKGYKEEYNLLEKAESEQQQKIFGLALSVKRGQTPRSEVSDRVLKIVDGMGEKEIRKFAKTKHEGIPHKVEAKEEVIRQELIARMINKIEEQSEIYVDEAKLPSSMKKGKRTRETGIKVKGFLARPATKEKGTVRVGEVVPVRLGGEGRGGNRGIRSNTSPSGSPKETQRRRKQQKMREAIETPQQKEKPQNPSAINQVLQAKAKADAAKKDLANKQRMASQRGVELTSIS